MFWRVILFCWLATHIALANPTRSGTLTWSGSLPAPAVEVTVNGATAQTNGDFTFTSSGLTLSNGANTFTVIAANALGLHTTNTFTRNLPVSVNVYTDAAGNGTALLDGNENVADRYLYDPFGRLLGQWGSLANANANRMQFSSMPHHGNSGLSLYPFRAYDPVLQRWLSRDPIGEAGGIGLYAFAGNSPLNAVDSDGRVLHILAGAAAGALIGGGFSIASDLFHGRDVDWVQAGISATEGAIAGAVASATFGTSLAGSGLALAARGAAAGLAGDLAAQGAGLAAQTRQCFSFKEAGLSTLLGAGGPLAGKFLGKFFERFAKDEIAVAPKTLVQSLDPASIRFSQSSVNAVEEIAASMRANGWQGAPIDVVRMSDGALTTFDNTRLLAASRAGIDVQAVVRGAGEAFPAGRWTPRSGIQPTTWEEAVQARIQQQNRLFRQRYPNGSPITSSAQ